MTSGFLIRSRITGTGSAEQISQTQLATMVHLAFRRPQTCLLQDLAQRPGGEMMTGFICSAVIRLMLELFMATYGSIPLIQIVCMHALLFHRHYLMHRTIFVRVPVLTLPIFQRVRILSSGVFPGEILP